MTDKARITILRRELRRIAEYIDDVSPLLTNGGDWKNEDGAGSVYRGAICALEITRRPSKKATE